MEMSVREARANFAHALDAAERGERVRSPATARRSPNWGRRP